MALRNLRAKMSAVNPDVPRYGSVTPRLAQHGVDEPRLRSEAAGHRLFIERLPLLEELSLAERQLYEVARDTNLSLSQEMDKWSASFGTKTQEALQRSHGFLQGLLQLFDYAESERKQWYLVYRQLLRDQRATTFEPAFRPKGTPLANAGSMRPRPHHVTPEERERTAQRKAAFLAALDAIEALLVTLLGAQ